MVHHFYGLDSMITRSRMPYVSALDPSCAVKSEEPVYLTPAARLRSESRRFLPATSWLSADLGNGPDLRTRCVHAWDPPLGDACQVGGLYGIAGVDAGGCVVAE